MRIVRDILSGSDGHNLWAILERQGHEFYINGDGLVLPPNLCRDAPQSIIGIAQWYSDVRDELMDIHFYRTYPQTVDTHRPGTTARVLSYGELHNDPEVRHLALEAQGWVKDILAPGSERAKCLVPRKEPEFGFLYLFKAKGFPLYKIGVTGAEVEERLSQVQRGMPFECEVVDSWFCRGPYEWEGYWHSFFEENRTKGEWFSLDEKQIATLNRDMEEWRVEFIEVDA